MNHELTIDTRPDIGVEGRCSCGHWGQTLLTTLHPSASQEQIEAKIRTSHDEHVAFTAVMADLTRSKGR